MQVDDYPDPTNEKVLVGWLRSVLRDYKPNDIIPMSFMKYCYHHLTNKHLLKTEQRNGDEYRGKNVRHGQNNINGQNNQNKQNRLYRLLSILVQKSPVIAAENGEVGILALLHQMSIRLMVLSEFWSPEVCAAAAYGGSLSCLKYAHRHGCPWNGDSCVRAAIRGHIDCLRYMYSHRLFAPHCHEYAQMAGHDQCAQFIKSATIPLHPLHPSQTTMTNSNDE